MPLDTQPEIDRSSAAEPTPAGLGWPMVCTFTLATTVLVALRSVYLFHYRFDSDEPQHLHVAWAWTQGLLPYRDVFDNHAPLFHLLTAPLVTWIGEDPEILLWMRGALLPVYLFIAWSTVRLGRRLFSTRIGVAAAVVSALCPPFFFPSIEFRADALWAALWLASMATLIGGSLTIARSLTVGLLLGAALATSLKTLPLLVGSFAGAACAVGLTSGDLPRPWAGFWRCSGAIAAGTAVVPSAFVAFFGRRHALAPLLDCVVLHNGKAMALWHKTWVELAFFAALVPLSIHAARFLAATASTPAIARRRTLLLIGTTAYFVLLGTVWPLVPAQDNLPAVPLAAIFLSAAADVGAGFLLPSSPRSERLAWLLAGACLLCTTSIVTHVSPWEDRTRFQSVLVQNVLQLTRHEDFAMDTKGEMLFRRRPFYFALEHIADARIRLGEIPDDIPERLIATRSYVATNDDDRYPPRARKFLDRNFLSVGVLRVAGQRLARGTDPAGTRAFDIEIPGSYSIVTPHGPATGFLDGMPYRQHRHLARGKHTFTPAGAGDTLALLWARAARLGYAPVDHWKDGERLEPEIASATVAGASSPAIGIAPSSTTSIPQPWTGEGERPR